MDMISQAARIRGDPTEELSHPHGKRGITSAPTRTRGGSATPAPTLLRGLGSGKLNEMPRMPCAGYAQAVIPPGNESVERCVCFPASFSKANDPYV